MHYDLLKDIGRFYTMGYLDPAGRAMVRIVDLKMNPIMNLRPELYNQLLETGVISRLEDGSFTTV